MKQRRPLSREQDNDENNETHNINNIINLKKQKSSNKDKIMPTSECCSLLKVEHFPINQETNDSIIVLQSWKQIGHQHVFFPHFMFVSLQNIYLLGPNLV